MNLTNPVLKHIEKGVLALCVLLMVWFTAVHVLATGGQKVDPDAMRRQLKTVTAKAERSDPKSVEYVQYNWAEPTKLLATAWNAADWITSPLWPPPPKGIVRNRPKVLAPDALKVYAYRGTVLVYDRDKEGKIKRRVKPVRDQGAVGGERVDGMRGAPGRDVAPAGAAPGGRLPRRGAGYSSDRSASLGGDATGALPGDLLIFSEDEAATQVEAGRRREGESLEPGEQKVVEGEPMFKGEPRRWVLITALFRNLEQINEFERALKVREPVEYGGVEVQRRRKKTDGTWDTWKAVTYELDYFGNLPEKQNARHAIFRELAQPLPLLARGAWKGRDRREVLIEADRAHREAKMELELELKQKSRKLRAFRRPGAAEADKDKAKADEEEARLTEEAIQQRAAEVVKTILVRFIDITVEPDCTYQYRMRIWVRNPNFGLRNVEDPMVAKDEFITTPSDTWSECSEVVHIEPDVHFYCRQGPVGKRAAQVEIHRWAAGDWQIHQFQLPVGDWMGHERPVRVIDVYGEEKQARIDFQKRGRKGEKGEKGYVLLDVDTRELAVRVGSVRMPRRVVSDLIYVDARGNIGVRHSATDEDSELRRRREKLASDLKKLIRRRKQAVEEAATPEIGAEDAGAMEGMTPVPGGGRRRTPRPRRGAGTGTPPRGRGRPTRPRPGREPVR